MNVQTCGKRRCRTAVFRAIRLPVKKPDTSAFRHSGSVSGENIAPIVLVAGSQWKAEAGHV